MGSSITHFTSAKSEKMHEIESGYGKALSEHCIEPKLVRA